MRVSIPNDSAEVRAAHGRMLAAAKARGRETVVVTIDFARAPPPAEDGAADDAAEEDPLEG